MPGRTSEQQLIAERYALKTPLGQGGMGIVWRAHDDLLQREVAVKEIELPRSVAESERESIRKRVLREARAAARLNHPNAVTVYDVVEEDGKAFIVMELIEGQTLADVVKNEGPLPADRTAEVALAVLGALQAAHAEGIVHRDVKPANVMIPPNGGIKLADFGIASVKDDPKITASGIILGSPSYMAPEQANHGTSGPEADMWGLGATLYYAVEGTPPFEREGAIPTLTAVLGDEPRPMQKADGLGPVISGLLEKDPNKRTTAEQARIDLTQVVAGDGHTRTAVLADAQPTQVETDPGLETERSAAAAPTPTPAAAPQQISRPAPATTGDRGKWIALALALAVLVIAAFFVVPNLGGEDEKGGRTDRQRKEQPAAGGNADEDSEAVPEEEGAVDAPSDWTTYEDPDIGYTIEHPSDWEPSVEENGTFFYSPEGDMYLQVAYVQPPTAETPEAAWYAQEENFASTHENYQRIGITPTTYQGMDAAAWEFTYEDGGTTLHAVNFGFITTDESTGMTLLFQTHEDVWDDSQDTFEQFKAGFRPPA